MTISKTRTAASAFKAFCFATVAMGACQAAAQDAAGDQAVLEEIVVTARKTTENVQDVPLTVNVITEQRLINAGVVNTSQIRNLVSNLYWEDRGGGTTENSITLRGISSNASRQGFDAGIGIYIDEVYISDTTGFNTALLDIDRVEVLKGPQGTLFGRNTTAGAVSVHTRRPSTDGFSTEVSARIGTPDLYEARAVTNLPLSDKVALKLSGIYRDRGGYQTNVLTGDNDLNDEKFFGGRAQLLFTPTPDLDILATADWFKNDDHQNISSCWGGSACGYNPTFNSIFNDKAGDNHSSTQRTLWSTALNLNWRMPAGYELTSITAYQNRKYRNDQDQDYTQLDYIRSGYDEPKSYQFSEELRIATPRDARLRGVGGLYFSHEDRTIKLPSKVDKALVSMVIGGPAPDILASTNARIRTTSWAAFGQATYDITPTLIGELGLRYSSDAKDFTYEQTLNPEALALPNSVKRAIGAVTFGPIDVNDSWGQATGLASLSWRPTEDFNAYVRFSQGYKSGAYQATILTAGNCVIGTPPVATSCNTPGSTLTVLTRPDIPVRPETLDAWEVGLKSELFDHRLRLNAAAFIMDYTDIQTQITDPATGFRFITNGGSARSQGVEFEASLAPIRGLVIDAGLGFQHAKYVEDNFVSGGNVTNFKGKRLPYAPRTSANLTGTYRFDVAEGWEMMTSASANYRSSMFIDSSNNFLSPAVTTLSGRVGFESDKGWGVFLWGDNLTDARRITGTTPGKFGLSVRNYYISPPRTYGVELKAKF